MAKKTIEGELIRHLFGNRIIAYESTLSKCNVRFPNLLSRSEHRLLFYLKRLRAEVDYCLQRIQEKKTKNNILVSNSLNKGSTCLISKNTNIITSLQYENTVSLTLLADLHLFTFLTIPELSVGIKYLYALEKRTSRFEFVCNMTPGVRRLSRCRRE